MVGEVREREMVEMQVVEIQLCNARDVKRSREEALEHKPETQRGSDSNKVSVEGWGCSKETEPSFEVANKVSERKNLPLLHCFKDI